MTANEFIYDAIMYSTGCIMEFIAWLSGEMEERGWSQADLARASGLSRGTVGNILRQERQPGKDVCIGIAKALGLSPATVFRRAGILPQEPEYVPFLDDWTQLFYELTPDEQQEVLKYGRYVIQNRGTKKTVSQPQKSRSKRPARSILKRE